MLKIYICEDMEAERDKMQKVIENIVLMEDLDMELCCVSADPFKILEKVKETQDVGIYYFCNHTFGNELYDIYLQIGSVGLYFEGCTGRIGKKSI